jgi:acetyl-CoA C-acetyltransferase
MKFEDSAIPLGFAWSSPFIRWQGALADVSSNDLAVTVTAEALRQRQMDLPTLTHLVVGQTIPQNDSFYAPPWIASRIGAPHLTGALVHQACATSVACLTQAAATVETASDSVALAVGTDRLSNGPLVIYPTTRGMGGTPAVERWVLDNFEADPATRLPMHATADAVASEAGFTRAQADEMTLQRYTQYEASLAGDRAFQRRYFQPVVLKDRKSERRLEADEGIHPYTADGLARLKPVTEGGIVTGGNQTHPADGCAGAIVCSMESARRLANGAGVARIVSAGIARAEPARMPKASTLAAQAAVARAGLSFEDIAYITTHNPFVVNDLWLCRETGFPSERVNPFGCSLIFGHPHAATGLRCIAELLEALRLRGGGYGLFTGCAAGDSGAAIVFRVDDG